MDVGFVPDLGYGTYALGHWHAGTPKKSFWSGLELKKKTMIPIGALRCTRCGFVDLYADARFAPR